MKFQSYFRLILIYHYSGVGQTLTIYENFQVWSILQGMEYTQSRKLDGGSESVIKSGQSVVLVSAAQVWVIVIFS